MSIKNLSALALALAFGTAGLADPAQAQTVVTADVVTDTVWGGAANPSPIILDGPIFVKSGAKLTILPGTDVRGVPRRGVSPPVARADVPGLLIVTQTGTGDFQGSAAGEAATKRHGRIDDRLKRLGGY